MTRVVNNVWSSIKRFGFAPMRPYETTAPLHHQLKNTSLTNLWGWKPFATFLYALPSLRHTHTELDTNERIIEIPWIYSQLDFEKPKKILDVGWLESTVSISLATAGFDVTGIDIRQGELSHPNLTTVVGDICQSTLKKNSFDYVILLSTLEHIGLDTVYGKAGQETSDQRAIDECFRVLKPGGKLLLTTPVATKLHQDNFMRLYTPKRLQQMLKKWHIDSITYYAPKLQRQYWQITSATALPQPPHFGVALLSATKSISKKPRSTT